MKTMSDPPQPWDSSVNQPPYADRGWPRMCGPLLAFLTTPRTWSELNAWASERGMSGCRLRNMLAWLEGEGIAGTYVDPRLQALGGQPRIWRRYGATIPS
jgi:hypothetical protein